MKKIIIAAVSLNNVIGIDFIIPWNNKEEIKYFKETTLNHTILMGRKTFMSIGKPLNERTNLVVSRSESSFSENSNLFYFTSIKNAMNFAEKSEVKKTYIIGGSEIYFQMINDVDELLISRMPIEIEGDKYFPNINNQVWNLNEVKTFKSFKVEKYIRNVVKR